MTLVLFIYAIGAFILAVGLSGVGERRPLNGFSA